jgi:hypothetical protein
MSPTAACLVVLLPLLQGLCSEAFTLHMAVGKKDSYSITLLPGDGIGPEITKATVAALEPLQSRFGMKFTEAYIGGSAIDAKGTPWPAETAAQIKASDSVLLSAIGGPKWDSNPRELRPETGLLAMRKELGLFANLRPAKVMSQLLDASTLKPEVVEGVDIMVVRELTGDVYFGEPKVRTFAGGGQCRGPRACWLSGEVGGCSDRYNDIRQSARALKARPPPLGETHFLPVIPLSSQPHLP